MLIIPIQFSLQSFYYVSRYVVCPPLPQFTLTMPFKEKVKKNIPIPRLLGTKQSFLASSKLQIVKLNLLLRCVKVCFCASFSVFKRIMLCK